MKGFLALRALFDHPPIDGGVIHVYSTFLHECFDVTRAQRIRHIPADPIRMTSGGKCAPLKSIAIVALPHHARLLRDEDDTSKRLK